jgi:hypothetical protein
VKTIGCLQHCPKAPWPPRGGGGRRERPERPAEAAGCTRRGEMKWSSPAKPGLQRAAAGLAGSADHSASRGGQNRSRRASGVRNGGRQPASTCIAKRPIARGIGRHGSGARALSQHVADVGGAGRIGEHGGARSAAVRPWRMPDRKR